MVLRPAHLRPLPLARLVVAPERRHDLAALPADPGGHGVGPLERHSTADAEGPVVRLLSRPHRATGRLDVARLVDVRGPCLPTLVAYDDGERAARVVVGRGRDGKDERLTHRALRDHGAVVQELRPDRVLAGLVGDEGRPKLERVGRIEGQPADPRRQVDRDPGRTCRGLARRRCTEAPRVTRLRGPVALVPVAGVPRARRCRRRRRAGRGGAGVRLVATGRVGVRARLERPGVPEAAEGQQRPRPQGSECSGGETRVAGHQLMIAQVRPP